MGIGDRTVIAANERETTLHFLGLCVERARAAADGKHGRAGEGGRDDYRLVQVPQVTWVRLHPIVEGICRVGGGGVTVVARYYAGHDPILEFTKTNTRRRNARKRAACA